MNRYSPRTKLYITIAVIIFIFLGLIGGAILPLINKVSSLSSQYIETKQQIVNIEEKRNQISKIETEYNQIKDSIDKINNSLVDPNRFLDTIIKLEQMAEQTNNRHNIAIIEQDPKAKKSNALPKFISFRVSLIGSFQDSINFMNTLENSNFYNRIDKVEMVKAGSLPNPDPNQPIKETDIRTTLEVKIFTNQ